MLVVMILKAPSAGKDGHETAKFVEMVHAA